MGLRQQTIRDLNQFCAARDLAVVLLFLVAFCTASAAVKSEARVFTQEAVGIGAQGSPLNMTIIHPDSLQNLVVLSFDLGSSRVLEIHSNLPPSRGWEINGLAAVIRRCYEYLDSNLGRSVPGGVLLYLIEYPQRPRYYRFQVEVADSAPWNQVRVALLNSGQPLLGPGASSHVTEFIYDTLPHELTHGLLTMVPTVHHDLDGQASRCTRWFIEGLCEKMAKGFSSVESPAFHRKALGRRNLDCILVRPDLCSGVWQWGQASELSWSDESDLYGVSMLLVTAWSEQVDLADLLALMSLRGGDFNGEGLKDLLAETAGLDPLGLLIRARYLARGFSSSSPLSLLQTP